MEIQAPRTPEHLLRIEDLHVRFGAHHALRGVDLEVSSGDVLAIIGPSGSGKSTLLRSMNLLHRPTSGSVWFEGRDLTDVRTDLNDVRRRIGIVFQSYNLFPHRSVTDNITLALRKVLRLSREEADERARVQLRHVGLEARGSAYPSELSGGQQQRVAIARALAMQPDLILLDEVTSALDPELVGEVLAVIARLAEEGATMSIVTHEIAFARRVATRVVFVDEGRIVETGPPEVVLENPSSERLKRFMAQVL